jgi:hypothetical protein
MLNMIKYCNLCEGIKNTMAVSDQLRNCNISRGTLKHRRVATGLYIQNDSQFISPNAPK